MASFLPLVALVWLCLAIGVAFDAAGRGRSPVLWFFGTVIFGIFAVLAYLAVLPSEKTRQLERRIDRIEEHTDFCIYCGADLDGDECPDCRGGEGNSTLEQESARETEGRFEPDPGEGDTTETGQGFPIEEGNSQSPPESESASIIKGWFAMVIIFVAVALLWIAVAAL